MCCQLTHLPLKFGRLLVKFESGQQSVKLSLFGINKSCNELSLERRYLSYAGGFRMQTDTWARALDSSIFDRDHVVDWKSSCNLCEPEARVVFPKRREYEASRRHVVMWWRNRCCVAHGFQTVVYLVAVWRLINHSIWEAQPKCLGVGKHVRRSYGVHRLTPCITWDQVGVTNYR